MHTIEQVLDLPAIRAEIAELGQEVAAPDLWDDQANAQRVTGRLSVLQGDLDRFTSLQQRLDDLGVLLELAQEEADADSLHEA
jgi:peptide chain release factor 2